MFVERKVCYSALFTNLDLIGWHAGAVSLAPSVVIFAQLAFPLNDVMFCLHSVITNLSLYKHWVTLLNCMLVCLSLQAIYTLVYYLQPRP